VSGPARPRGAAKLWRAAGLAPCSLLRCTLPFRAFPTRCITSRLPPIPNPRPAYQGQVSLFLAPPPYVLRDYLTWSDSGSINAEQVAFLRPKIHDSIDYTWADLAACASATNNASNVQAGTAPRMSQARGRSGRTWAAPKPLAQAGSGRQQPGPATACMFGACATGRDGGAYAERPACGCAGTQLSPSRRQIICTRPTTPPKPHFRASSASSGRATR
jgi:hypothetical protein